jgi:hypothetical protein
MNTPRSVKASLLVPGDQFVNPSTGIVAWTVTSYPLPQPFGFVSVTVRDANGVPGTRKWQSAGMVNSISPKN